MRRRIYTQVEYSFHIHQSIRQILPFLFSIIIFFRSRINSARKKNKKLGGSSSSNKKKNRPHEKPQFDGYSQSPFAE